MKSLIGKIIFIACIVIVIWAWVEGLGLFKTYETRDIQPINVDRTWDGSFTGRNGPCNYMGHNCPKRCNDWREQPGGGSKCNNCGHDLIFHDAKNLSY